MNVGIATKIANWYRRHAAKPCYVRRQRVNLDAPIVSFTFDDFPRTALHAGGAILKEYRVQGTYFAALGLLGKDSPSGIICTEHDLLEAAADGHEIGCHTFAHCHSWNTDWHTFERSLDENQDAISQLISGYSFRSFAYPLSLPRPSVKHACARHFECSRGGGQAFNSGVTDLNQLSAFFLEQANGNWETVRQMIDQNRTSRGWLIFATHDVADRPSPYGCSIDLFRKSVQYAISSGAQILPVAAALDLVRGRG